MQGLGIAATALLLQALAAPAQEPQPGSTVGDRYEIRRESLWSQSSGDGTSGNSSSRDMLTERVIAVREAGVELEFDLPEDASAEDRARIWQLPVRVLRPPQGPLQLLNGPELEARVDRWLAAAGWTRARCGRWYFTWNAFQIECDPQLVIERLSALELRLDDLRDGAPYRAPGSRAPAPLRREARGSDGATFLVDLEVDPAAVRRERARTDAVIDELLAESGPRSVRRDRSGERISGTIRIAFETDAAGRVRRRTTVTEVATEGPDGVRDTETVTETVERRLVPRAGS